MSHTNITLDDAPVSVSFADLVLALSALNIEFRRQGEALALKNAALLTADLKDAVTEHKATLLDLVDVRAELIRLHKYIIRLRLEDPPKGTRQEALVYVQKQINRLGKRLGGASGYEDPADPFAEDAMIGLQAALSELTAYGNPYPVPLPAGCVLLSQANFDPFEHGRYFSGAVISSAAIEGDFA